MKRTTNEQGYALLLVLFLIFFILLASAVFIKGSISNAKQEKKVDMNHLSVVAAEMGVDYFTAAYTNQYYAILHKHLETYRSQFQSEKIKLEKDYKNKPEELNRQIELLRRKLRGELTKKIEQSLKDTVIAIPQKDIHFMKKTSDLDVINSSDEGITIQGIVRGEYESGKEAPLNYLLTFRIPVDWTGASTSETIPTGLPSCPKGDEIEGKKCVINSNGTHQRKELEIEESQVYVTSNLMITEDFDIEENSKVVINGFLKVHGKKNDEDEGEFDIEDSETYVSQDVDVKGELEMENAYLYVGKDLMVSDDLELEDDSKICVEKNVKISGDIDIEKGSIIYYKGNLVQPKSHNRIIKLSESEFNSQCKVISNTPEQTTWDPPNVSVNY